MKRLFIVILFFATSVLHSAFAQKRVIDTTAYKDWKLIQNPKMSDNGQWIVYRYAYLFPEESSKDPDFTMLFNTKTKKEIKLEHVTGDVNFINNDTWLRYDLFKDNKNITILHSLKTGKVIEWDRPEYFMSSNNSAWINYSYVPNQESYEGRRFVLYNFETKDSIAFENLLNYKLLDDHNLVYLKKKNKATVLIHNKGLHNPITIFKTEEGSINMFSIDDASKKGTFLIADENRNNKQLYEFDLAGSTPKLRIDFDKVPQATEGFVIERSNYSTNDKSVIFPYLTSTNRSRMRPERPKKDDSGVEIWKWNEGAMARRNRSLGRGSSRPTPLKYAYNIDANTFVAVTVNTDEQLVKPEQGDLKYVFVLDPTPYQVDLDWTFEQKNDLYIVETATGKRKLILKETLSTPIWNPNGNHAVIFNQKKRAWEHIVIKNGDVSFVNLTKDIPYAVYDQEYDVPLKVPHYGIKGWIDGGNTVVISDKYDFWGVNLIDKHVSCITKGYGRKNMIRFSLLYMDYDANLNLGKEALLKGFNDVNKSSGVYKLNGGQVKQLIDGDFNVKMINTSKNSKYALWYKESYNQSPDLWWSNTKFSKPVRVSNINPQQDDLRWGSTEVFSWKDINGEKNEGLLFLPENYDPKKKYPTIVYFYEKSTPDRFTFMYPTYSESSLNIPAYVSQDYIIFQPDINFKIGHTGESSSNIIISGTKALIEQGIADTEHVAVHGHSFGGYQTAYVTTQTDMFTCAVPASVVTNLSAGYTSLRGNGLSSMFMYEAGQMRMGKSMFDDLDGYMKNSTIFHVKDIKTPTLIFHCDADGIVPYEQGMALFLSMRRLKKPVWLINYKKERHDLSRIAAKKDWTIRLQGFFDYYLKDNVRPDWME